MPQQQSTVVTLQQTHNYHIQNDKNGIKQALEVYIWC